MRSLLKVTRPAEVYRKLSGVAQRLTPGERMPSFKTVMRDSGVGLGVVDLAYERLLEQGVVESRPRSGMYVANPYAHALVVYVCNTLHLHPEQGAAVRQAYLALREAVPQFFPGAAVELLVVEHDSEWSVVEQRISKRLADIVDRYRVMGVVCAFRVDGARLFDYCRLHGIPLLDSGTPNPVHPRSAPWTDHALAWQLGLDHLREQGWPRRLAMVHVSDRASGKSREGDIRGQIAGIAAEAVVDCLHAHPDDDFEALGIGYVKRLIAEGPLDRALMVCDDYLMRGMLIGALEAGVKLAEACPVVVLSNENTPIHATRELTRVEIRHGAIASEKLAAIRAALQAGADPASRTVPPALIVGRSSLREDYSDFGKDKNSENGDRRTTTATITDYEEKSTK